VTTGIYKDPVEGRIRLRPHQLDGDGQADRTVHGGWDKAVYVYPSEHYAFWRIELPGLRLPYGSFGENFTTEGLEESTVYIGDQFSIGSAVVEVTQPRMPCYKLGVRFGRLDMPQRFHASGRCGFYLAVVAKVTWEPEMLGSSSTEGTTRCPCVTGIVVLLMKRSERRRYNPLIGSAAERTLR
jgi:MOSC domain-containing protein YiiM